jgi:cyanophycinase
MGKVFLIGGGWEPQAAEAVFGPFLGAVGGSGAVGCLIIDEGDGAAQFARYEAVLRKVAPACEPVPLLVPIGGTFDIAALDEVGALLVCGGLTPAYQEALAEVLDRLPRLLREREIPYAGFSAGAAVAAGHAVVGGWRSGGVPVCPEDTGEDLEEIGVRPGLGLVPFGVDVHAAQWGTLPRMIAAVERGDVPRGVTIDENTLLEVHAQEARVSGLGQVRTVRRAEDGGVLVRTYGAGESFTVE